MFVFRKIWRILFSLNIRFEIRPFALLPTIYLVKDGPDWQHMSRPIIKRCFETISVTHENHHYLCNQSSSDIVRLSSNGKSHAYFKGAFSGLSQFLANESPLKMMKNAFYFTLKLLFFYLNVRLDFWVTQTNGLINKVMKMRLISKCHNPVKKQFKCTCCLISQEVKVIKQWNLVSSENITRNIFLEQLYTECGWKIIPRPFPKKPKLIISLDQKSKDLYYLFLLYAKFKAIEMYWN